MATKIQLRRGLEADTPQLDEGEPAWTTDTQKFTIGSPANNGNTVLFYPGMLDGYANSDAFTPVSTYEAHKSENSENFQTILKELDGYVDADGYIELGANSSVVVDNDGYVFANKAIHTCIGSTYVPDNEAVVVDWSLANSHVVDLNATTTNCAIDFAGGVAGGSYLLKIQQHATAAKTVSWGGDILFAGGEPTAVTDTANAIDLVSVFYDGVNWFATVQGDFKRTS